jgi:hypothetical protein
MKWKKNTHSLRWNKGMLEGWNVGKISKQEVGGQVLRASEEKENRSSVTSCQ